MVLALGLFWVWSGGARAQDPMIRLLAVLEDQQRIIREQHAALMYLLKERGRAVPSVPVAQAAPEPVAAQRLASVQPSAGVSAVSDDRPQRRWYVGGAARGTHAGTDHATPDDDCVATSIAGFSSTSCDQTLKHQSGSAAEFSTGYGAGLSLGYRFFDWLRLEGELGVDRHGVDRIKTDPRKGFRDAGGQAVIATGLISAFADFKTGTAITPYVGIGLGGYFADLQNVHVLSTNRDEVDDSAFGAAIAGMAGVEWSLNEDWSLTAGYRYLFLPDLRAKTSRQVEGSASLDFHQFSVGFRRYW